MEAGNRLHAGIVAVLLLLLCSPNVVDGGRYISTQTKASSTITTVYDVGIPVATSNRLLIEVTFEKLAWVILSKTTTSKQKNFYLIGLQKKGIYQSVILKYKCLQCGNTKKVNANLNVPNAKVWIRWTNNSIKVGNGLVENEATFFEFEGTHTIPVRYISLVTPHAVGYWRFLVDEPPVIEFPEHGRTISVPENEAVGKSIYVVRASDPEQDTLTFSVTDQHKGMFTCRGNDIVLSKPLNRDTESMYNVILRVSDEVNTVARSLLVVVTDVNDKTPEVRVSDAVIVQRKLGGASLYGGTVSAADADVNDTLTYQLIERPSTVVVVDPQSGVVSLNQTAKIIEKTFPQIFTIAVTDKANHVTTANFSLSVVSSSNGGWTVETITSQPKARIVNSNTTGGSFTTRMKADNHTASNMQKEHQLQTRHTNMATLCHNLAPAVVQTSAVYLLLRVLLFYHSL